MPYKKQHENVRYPLPSDENYWVEWRPSLTYGDVKAATFATTSDEGEVDRSAAADALLLAHIAAWNLDDEAGNVLPLTPEHLAILAEEDANFLSGLLAERLRAQEASRKSSPTTSGPSRTAR